MQQFILSERAMTRFPYRHAVPVALAAAIFTGIGTTYAQGVTDYKPGEGGGPITGSASGVNGAAATDAAPTLERCPAPLGTMAVAEPQEFVSKALLRYSLPSPTSLIRLMIQQSNCFSVVERGVAMQNIMQERQLQQRGELSQGAQMGQGQLVTADFVLTPDVVFSENNAGGAGGALGAIGSLFGPVGMIVGMAAGGIKFKQAQTSMMVADTRSGLQVAAASGSVEKADWGVGGVLGGSSAIGALGAYANTAEGKIVAASFLDNWNNVVKAIRGNPALQRTSAAPQQAVAEKPPENPPAAAPMPDKKPAPAPEFQRGDVLVGKIGGIKMFAGPSSASRAVGTLGRTDVVVFLGREDDEFLNVRSDRGTGWIEKMFLKKSQ
ncbi:MAG: CsgG/HfaB family protein [Burkholderiales bacterium]